MPGVDPVDLTSACHRRDGSAVGRVSKGLDRQIFRMFWNAVETAETEQACCFLQ